MNPTWIVFLLPMRCSFFQIAITSLMSVLRDPHSRKLAGKNTSKLWPEKRMMLSLQFLAEFAEDLCICLCNWLRQVSSKTIKIKLCFCFHSFTSSLLYSLLFLVGHAREILLEKFYISMKSTSWYCNQSPGVIMWLNIPGDGLKDQFYNWSSLYPLSKKFGDIPDYTGWNVGQKNIS